MVTGVVRSPAQQVPALYRAEGSTSPLRADFYRVLFNETSATEQDSEYVQMMYSTRELISSTTTGKNNYLFLVLNLQMIPYEAPNLFRFLRWSEHFYRIFQNARRNGAPVGA